MEPKELKARLKGPIVSIPTPFKRDYSVDHEGVRRIIDFAIENGMKTILLTGGDSQFFSLSMEEIRELTKVVVEQVADRAVTIAATWQWWTGMTVDFAQYAQKIGADGFMVPRPSWASSDEAVYRHYKSVMEEIGLGIILQGEFSMSLLERLADIEQVVALKEDAGDRFYHDALRRVGNRLGIFCGGQYWRALYGYALGSTGFFAGSYGTLAPWIAKQFYEALTRGDLEKAKEIVNKYDEPLFAFGLAHPKGWQATWRAALEIFGLAQRWLRPPQESFSQEEVNELRKVFVKMGLLSP